MLRRDVAAWLARADAASLLALAREQPAAFARLAGCTAMRCDNANDDDDNGGGDDASSPHLCCALTALLGNRSPPSHL
jgi:hypothetical protein